MPSPPLLPVSGPWQLLLLRDAIEIADVELFGLLLVVHEDDGLVRQARPLASPDELVGAVLDAATDPPPPLTPARPRVLRCEAALAAALRPCADVLGAGLEICDHMPAAEAARDSLLASLGSGLERLPTSALDWPGLMAAALAAAPWRVMSDSVIFGLDSKDPAIDGRVVVVLGLAGEQLGFTMFPNVSAYERFRAAAVLGPELLTQLPLSFLCVHLSDAGQEAPAYAAAADRLGLLQAGLVLELYTVDDPAEGLRGLSDDEELLAFQVVQAVLGAFDEHGPACLLAPCSSEIAVHGGARLGVHVLPLQVLTDLGEPPAGLLQGAAHMLGVFPDGLFGDPLPTVVLKYAKADAVRCRETLSGVDRLECFSDDGIEVFGHCGATGRGVLLRLRHDDTPPGFWSTHPRIRLVIAAGGARRQSFRARDILLDVALPVGAAPGPAGGDDLGPLFVPRP